jgi:hypothetical protein
MSVRALRVPVSFFRMLVPFFVLAPSVMLGGGAMRLRGSVMRFGCFRVARLWHRLSPL